MGWGFYLIAKMILQCHPYLTFLCGSGGPDPWKKASYMCDYNYDYAVRCTRREDARPTLD